MFMAQWVIDIYFGVLKLKIAGRNIDLSLDRHVTIIYVHSLIFTITLYRVARHFKDKSNGLYNF